MLIPPGAGAGNGSTDGRKAAALQPRGQASLPRGRPCAPRRRRGGRGRRLFPVSLAVTRRDELGDLVDLYNQMADALRGERQDIKSRELLLDTVLQGVPVAILLVRDNGRVVLSEAHGGR